MNQMRVYWYKELVPTQKVIASSDPDIIDEYIENMLTGQIDKNPFYWEYKYYSCLEEGGNLDTEIGLEIYH